MVLVEKKMAKGCKTIAVFFIWIAAAAELQNPDFEIPPNNLTSNSLLSNASTIPGWSWNGTVAYASVTANGGHALQLRENGRINQTLIATNVVLVFFLSFDLMAYNGSCAGNYTSVNVSVGDRYKVMSLTRNLSDDFSERHGFCLGVLGGNDSVNLEIASVGTNSDGDLQQCWPLVDAFAVRTTIQPQFDPFFGIEDNLLMNGDFEYGPPFLNSSDGVIVQQDEQQDIHDRYPNSPLLPWSITGTIRYIDSDHYTVPQGKAAIELIPISGYPSGIQQYPVYGTNSRTEMTLNFVMGDANDSCIGDLIVFVRIGQKNVDSYTMRSSGIGAKMIVSMGFTFGPGGDVPSWDTGTGTSIGFYSYNETRTRDGVLCGPVLDDIGLFISYGVRMGCGFGVVVLGWVIGWLIIFG